MSDNKPPMTVWLNHGDTEHEPPWHELDHEQVTWSQSRTGMDFGPYVHLKQFMEEVERRANRSTFPHFDNEDEHTHKAMQELAKEIEEGKA